MATEQTVQQVIEHHKQNGRYINVQGLRTFVLDQGSGEAVFCIHGVPTSSFLYRKVLTELSGRGLRGICVDLPGLGLTERPEDFNYSFSGFAHFLFQAAQVLELDRFHLVVHDIGGPIGFALAVEHPEKILSLTILNTWADVVKFEKPLPMRPFEKPLLGEAELALITRLTWPLMFHTLGISDKDSVSKAETAAYVDLLKREDGGKAFLKIMRNFNHSPEFRDLCFRALQQVPYPVQAIWGAEDPALTFERYGREIQELADLPEVVKLPAKHFLQEEQAEAIAARIVAISRQG